MSDQQKDDQVPNTDSGNVSVDNTSNVPDNQKQQFEALVQTILGQKEAEIRELKGRLESVKSDAPKDPPATYDGFVSNPEGVVEKVVERTLNRMMQPILEETKILKKDRAYNTAKNEILVRDPRLATLFADPNFEARVRSGIASQDEITPGSLYGIALVTYGQMHLGGNGVPNSNNRVDNNRSGNTPSMRSDTPPAPKVSNIDDSNLGLSAEELSAAKFLGKTPAQYKALRDSDGSIDSLRAANQAK